jgi:hypothetical protein
MNVKNADGIFPMMPIDDAVRWARTSRGGKQFELEIFAASDTGCMRWGLCETRGAA